MVELPRGRLSPDLEKMIADATAGSGNGFDSKATVATKPPPRSFRLIPFSEIKLSTAPGYLVKGIIPRAAMTVVWGEPKCGKSFWTFDLMMHIALGRPYRDRRVTQGAVVYLALEGGHGFKARVEAWRQRYRKDHTGDVPFYLIDVPVDLISAHGSLIGAISQQLNGKMPAAVVV